MQGDSHLHYQTDDSTQHTTPSPQSTDGHHGRDDISSQRYRRQAGNSEHEVLPTAGDDGVSQLDLIDGSSRAEKLKSGGWGKAKSRRRLEPAAASSAWKAHGVLRRPTSPSQSRDPPIARLPVEGVAAILARLHPEALKTCALVCKAWSLLVRDDLTWKAALLYHFGLAESASLSKAPGKRIASTSWKAEYTVRHELVQRWSKSKTSTVVHDPRIGNITCFNAAIALKRLATTSTTGSAGKGSSSPRSSDSNPHGTAPSMVSVSVARGHASRSDPFNGKVAKSGFIDGAPNNAAIPGLEVVSCATVSADGALLAWGMGSGAVTVSRTALGGRGSFAAHAIRGSLPISVGLPGENHMGPVSSLCFVGTSDLLVSMAVDGMVKLWSCFSMVCLWTSPSATFEEHSNRMDEGTTLQACAGASSILIAVGTRSAAVHAWRVDTQSWQLRDYRRHAVANPTKIRGVRHLAVDPVTNAILICLDNDSVFYRLDLFDRLESSVVRFGHREGLFSTVTCLKLQEATPLSPDARDNMPGASLLDIPIPVQESTTGADNLGSLAYVVAGDDQGRTYVWDWSSADRDTVLPFRRMQGFETKVTSIAATDLVALVGTADGTVRAYDLLSGRLLRVFNDSSAPKHALRQLTSGAADREEAEKWAVGTIQVTADGFVASIGARILAWRMGDAGKGRKKGGQASGRTSSRPERFRSEYDVKRDIQDSTMLLDQEHAEMQSKHRDLKNVQAVAGIPQALGDLTEEEALAFATMLSQEAEEQRRVEQSLEESLIAGDLDYLELDEENGRYDSPGPSTSRHPGRGSGSSPLLHPSSVARASSPLSTYSRSPFSASSPAQMPQRAPDFEEQATWPLPSPSSAPMAGFATSPNRESASPPTGIWASRAGASTPSWSQVARRPLSPAFPESAIERDGRAGPGGAAADDMDEELQFALELSRAEDESRRGSV